MKVDRKELRKIADDAEKARKDARIRAKKREKAEKRKVVATARSAAIESAERIVNTVPEALKRSAARARGTTRTKSNWRAITARIPIVNERLDSIMAISGYLDDGDERILKAVRECLKKVRITNVALRVRYRIRERMFLSADGLDENRGPCKYYYLEAQTRI